MSRLITVARILKVRGIFGEVVAEILTDFPERFSTISNVRLVRNQVSLQQQIEDFWFHKNRIVFKFQGIDTPEAARELVGSQVQITEEERVDLPPDTFFDSDLKNCEVFERNTLIGVVKEIFKAGDETANFVIHTLSGLELMLPAVKEYVQRVDIVNKRIDVVIPEGLMDSASRID